MCVESVVASPDYRRICELDVYIDSSILSFRCCLFGPYESNIMPSYCCKTGDCDGWAGRAVGLVYILFMVA